MAEQPSKTETGTDTAAHKKSRSPNYPSMDLQEAMNKTELLYKAQKRHPVPVSVAAEPLGYGPKSSSFLQAIATLRAYGLIEASGSGDDRKIAVSERAMKILLDHRDKQKLLQEVAITPSIFKEIWEKFYNLEDGMAPDDSIKHHLIFDREGTYPPQIAESILADFKATIEFANLGISAIIPEHADSLNDKGPPRIGDFVQWESQGVMQFLQPRRVTGFAPDGLWAFIEGSPAGIAVSELSVVERSAAPKGNPPMNANMPPAPPPAIIAPLAPAAPGVKTETFALERGEIMVRFPATMTADDLANVKDWLPILERKFAKMVQTEESKTQ